MKTLTVTIEDDASVVTMSCDVSNHSVERGLSDIAAVYRERLLDHIATSTAQVTVARCARGGGRVFVVTLGDVVKGG